jgi:3-methyladenine DNA glycosylase AlkD
MRRERSLRTVRRDIREVATAERAKTNSWFFKTGPGQYGEGDRFLGVSVPALRTLARDLEDLPLKDLLRLLKSQWHEERLLALLILVRQYLRAEERTRRVIHQLYLSNTRSINSWDLVDLSAAQIVGAHLENRDRRLLRRLARSDSTW